MKSKARVVFLDIDGVLTSARAHVALLPENLRGLIWHHFDPVAIGFLNRLCERYPDLRFVLSSSWRLSFDQQTMTMMLSQAGWRGQWHANWLTPSHGSYTSRGLEINAWVQEHKPAGYVILDDMENGWLAHQRLHWVQTSEEDGMNSLRHFREASEILKRKLDYPTVTTEVRVDD